MRWLRTLASQILLGVLGILLATVAIGGMLYLHLTASSLDRQYETRALDIASTVAQIPNIRTGVANEDRDGQIRVLAEQIRSSTDASYVVVTDRNGLRFSHPNPALIGQRLEEPVAVLDGRTHVGIDHGSLGRSANGKAPVTDARGAIIGQVSVGILETRVSGELSHERNVILLYSIFALAIGTAVSLMLARTLKRRTFGLELAEIASLLQEREAMLYGIREGVIGIDNKGRVTVMNDEARRLLHVSSKGTGEQLTDLLPSGRLRDLLTGAVTGADLTALTDDALLVVNHRPVVLAGRNIGSIVTLRDRTEFEVLIRRMNAVTGLTDALRAQEHEFTNRMHVLTGLLDLGEYEEAREYLNDSASSHLVSAEDLRARIAPATLAALLLAKFSVAAERGVELMLTADSHLDLPDGVGNALMTIIGNLIDNAVDAVASLPAPRTVTVQLTDEREILIVVTDNGPGVPADARELIFTDGYSTKTPRGQIRRGVGLALVRRLVTRAGGSIEVSTGQGAQFRVRMPLPTDIRPTDSPGTLEGIR